MRDLRNTPLWWTTQTSPHTLRGLMEFAVRPTAGIPSGRGGTGGRASSSALRLAPCPTAPFLRRPTNAWRIAMNRHGRQVQLRRGRRASGSRLPRHRADRSSAIKQVASGRFGVTSRISGLRKGNPDQNGAGRKARRGRPSARQKGLPVDGKDPLFHPRRLA